jgi:hypothetical protein
MNVPPENNSLSKERFKESLLRKYKRDFKEFLELSETSSDIDNNSLLPNNLDNLASRSIENDALVKYVSKTPTPRSFIIYRTNVFDYQWRKIKFDKEANAISDFNDLINSLRKDINNGYFNQPISNAPLLHKRRVPINGGKSGGGRAIYNFLDKLDAVCLLCIYMKENKKDLTQKEAKSLLDSSAKAMAKIIQHQTIYGRQNIDRDISYLINID